VSVSLASLDRPRQLPNTAPISPWLRTRHLQPVASGSIFGPRSLRGLITGAPVRAEIGFPVFPTHLAGLGAICDSPLLTGLSGLLRIGGAPLAEALSALFRVCTALFLAEATTFRGILTTPLAGDDRLFLPGSPDAPWHFYAPPSLIRFRGIARPDNDLISTTVVSPRGSERRCLTIAFMSSTKTDI
jgi:hypothetical protein